MVFGRKISRLGLLGAGLTLGFRSADRSQLQRRPCCLWLQDFSETSSLYFASHRWCFPYHTNGLEKKITFFFLWLELLGLALSLAWTLLGGAAWLWVCVRMLPVSSLPQKASPFAPASNLGGSAAVRAVPVCWLSTLDSAVCSDFPGWWTQSRIVTESRTYKNGI